MRGQTPQINSPKCDQLTCIPKSFTNFNAKICAQNSQSAFLSLACNPASRRIVTLLKYTTNNLTRIALGTLLPLISLYPCHQKTKSYDLKTLDPGRWGGSVPE